MPVGQLHELEVMALAVNYHRWIYRTVARFLGDRVLEVGGGMGSFSELLLARSRVVVVDNSPECTEYLRQRFRAQANVVVLDGDVTDRTLPRLIAAEQIDTVICNNVLEHIEDDAAALRNMRQALPRGGRLILLVPAHQRLYGTLDAVVGHFRRYEKDELRHKVRAAGFVPEHCRYFNSVGAIGRYVIGRVRQQTETGEQQVLFYDRYVVPVLSVIERVVSPPCGQSLIVVARNP
jgi:SAM-dependent methyltransferase